MEFRQKIAAVHPLGTAVNTQDHGHLLALSEILGFEIPTFDGPAVHLHGEGLRFDQPHLAAPLRIGIDLDPGMMGTLDLFSQVHSEKRSGQGLSGTRQHHAVAGDSHIPEVVSPVGELFVPVAIQTIKIQATAVGAQHVEFPLRFGVLEKQAVETGAVEFHFSGVAVRRGYDSYLVGRALPKGIGGAHVGDGIFIVPAGIAVRARVVRQTPGLAAFTGNDPQIRIQVPAQVDAGLGFHRQAAAVRRPIKGPDI